MLDVTMLGARERLNGAEVSPENLC